MILPPRKFSIFLAIMTVTITMLALAGCGVSVESEPTEAHAEGGCATAYECGSKQLKVEEAILVELEQIRHLEE